MNQNSHRNVFKVKNKIKDIVDLNNLDNIDIHNPNENDCVHNFEKEFRELRKDKDLELFKDITHIECITKKKYIERFEPAETYDFYIIEKRILMIKDWFEDGRDHHGILSIF